MTARQLLALWGALSILVGTPGGAAAAGKPDPLANRDWGMVTGYVLDRDTERPIAGARVALAHQGAFAARGRTAGATDRDGRFRVSGLIGRRFSRLDIMSVVDALPLGLIMPWGLVKKTRIIDAQQFLIQVEAPGHKPFVGRVAAQVSSADRYAAHLVDVLLAPEASALASAAPPDRPRERLLSYSVAPQIVKPRAKVTFTARFRLPRDGVQYSAGWYTGDRFFRFDEFRMKPVGSPDPETGARTFQATIEIPKRPAGEWASLRLWLDRDGRFNEVPLPSAREALLQVAQTPEAEKAAAVARDAYALEQESRHAEALERYREATQADPKRPSLWARIGYLSLQLNRPAEAVAAYEKLVAADPEHPEATAAQYAGALLAAGESERALRTLSEVEKQADRRKRPPREFLLALARAYLAHDELQKADDYFGRAVKVGRVPQELAQEFHLERALAAVKASPGSADARVGLARALFDLKRYEQAAAEYRQALRVDGANVWTHLDLAACLVALNRSRDAAEHYRQAVVLAPDNLEARLSLADCQRRLGERAAALENYRAVAEAPARRYDFRVRHGLGLALLAAGDREAAMEALGQAVHLAREKGHIGGTRIGTGMGILALTPKRVTIDSFAFPEAALDYTLLDALGELRRHPADACALYQAGAALIELGLAEQGLAMVKDVAAAGRMAATDARYIEALALARLGRRDEARAQLEAVIRDDPAHRRALLELARLSFDAGDAARGQAYLLRAAP